MIKRVGRAVVAGWAVGRPVGGRETRSFQGSASLAESKELSLPVKLATPVDAMVFSSGQFFVGSAKETGQLLGGGGGECGMRKSAEKRLVVPRDTLLLRIPFNGALRLSTKRFPTRDFLGGGTVVPGFAAEPNSKDG